MLDLSEEDLANTSQARLFGLLSYFRNYCPNFATRVTPLRKLVSNDALPWTSAHTKCFRELVQYVVDTVPIINFDPWSPARLEVSIGPQGIAGVLL